MNTITVWFFRSFKRSRRLARIGVKRTYTIDLSVSRGGIYSNVFSMECYLLEKPLSASRVEYPLLEESTEAMLEMIIRRPLDAVRAVDDSRTDIMSVISSSSYRSSGLLIDVSRLIDSVSFLLVMKENGVSVISYRAGREELFSVEGGVDLVPEVEFRRILRVLGREPDERGISLFMLDLMRYFYNIISVGKHSAMDIRHALPVMKNIQSSFIHDNAVIDRILMRGYPVLVVRSSDELLTLSDEFHF